METQFKTIYEKQYTEYSINLLLESKSSWQIRAESKDISYVRNYIDRYIQEVPSDIPIREDAKFLLLSGLHLMYIKPYRESQKNLVESILEEEFFYRKLAADIDLIFETSNQLAKELQKFEISGHIILQAVDRKWNSMNMSSANIWG